VVNGWERSIRKEYWEKEYLLGLRAGAEIGSVEVLYSIESESLPV